jgi:hypothetical protein
MPSVWTSRTFSTAAHSLAPLKALGVRLLVSHTRPDSPVLTVADEAFLEPQLTGAAWAEWALSVCRERRPDVLWVTREAEAAADVRDEFAALGTRLLCPSAEALRATRSKCDVYEAAEGLGIATPPWLRVTGPEQAAEVPLGWCVKPDTGQGAEDVYQLVDDWEGLPVFQQLPRRLVLEHVARNPRATWIALPWLPGLEHSVDVLMPQQVAAVRTKADGSRLQRAAHDDDLVEASVTLLGGLGVAPLGNVQWRELAGERVLLEVNPRPSGGLYRSSQALGVDLLAAALGLVEVDGARVEGVVSTTSVDVAVGVPAQHLQQVLPAEGAGALGDVRPLVPQQVQLAVGGPDGVGGGLEEVAVEEAVAGGEQLTA